MNEKTYQHKYGKTQTKFEHRNSLVYFSSFLNVIPDESNSREEKRLINEYIIDHNKRDQSSHLLKNSCQIHHTRVSETDFEILNGNYKSSKKENLLKCYILKHQKQYSMSKRK